MTLGAEPKKVAILGGLVVVILGAFYLNSSGDSSSTPSAPRVPATPPPAAKTNLAVKTQAPGRPATKEFRPVVPGGGRPEDKPDPAAIDPELRLDLLAKVQAVPPIEAGRNLFQFGAAPPPDKPIPAVPTGVPKISITTPPPPQPSLAQNTIPQPPPVQPIDLKYYGYRLSKSNGSRLAFLMDGEDIVFAEENQIVKKRYRIVKITQASIEIEDTQAKNTQTLKLQDIPS